MEALIKSGRMVAIISFLGGTLLLILYYFTGEFGILFLAYLFILLVGLVNLGILTTLLVGAYKKIEYRKRVLKTCFVIFLNVPVFVLYASFIIKLLNTMRVTFKNSTKTEFRQIRIIGCEQNQIEKLVPGESTTIWIKITGDCAISIEYLVDGKLKTEEVSGYCTNDNGQKFTFNIGTGQKVEL